MVFDREQSCFFNYFFGVGGGGGDFVLILLVPNTLNHSCVSCFNAHAENQGVEQQLVVKLLFNGNVKCVENFCKL